MLVKCQECGYVRQPTDTAPHWQCPACKAIYDELPAANETSGLGNEHWKTRDSVDTETTMDETDWSDGDLEERLWLAAAGQKILIQCILLGIVLGAAGRSQAVPVLVMFGLSIAVGVYSLIGILRICSGLEKTQNQKILFMVLAFLPVASLIAMVYLSVKTTRLLRKAGWTVGLFGGKPCSNF